MKLEEIEINNYRCIDHFKMDSIKPITIFVGRNNTGKSSLLESASLLCSGKNCWYDSIGDDLLKNIVERRGGVRNLKSMITIGESEAIIKGKINDNNGIVKISNNISNLEVDTVGKMNSKFEELKNSVIQYAIREQETREFTPESERRRVPTEIIQKRILTLFDDTKELTNLFITYTDESSTEFCIYLSNLLLERIQRYAGHFLNIQSYTRSSLAQKSNILFMLNPSTSYLQELQKRLIISGELMKLIRRLRTDIPYFEDIRESDDQFYIF